MSLKDTSVCSLQSPKSGSEVCKHCPGQRLFSSSRALRTSASPPGDEGGGGKPVARETWRQEEKQRHMIGSTQEQSHCG